jgi:maltose O-acetyltransferase
LLAVRIPLNPFCSAVLRHLLNFVLLALPPSRWFGLRRLLLKIARIDVANDACVCGGGWIYGRGQLSIGKGTWLSPGAVFYTHTDAAIQIGDRCDIGPEVRFIPGGHLIASAYRRAGQGTARRISVGNGTWIGAGSQILGGVEIGEGCVIAAGAVVTRDVPANSLAAGVPAVVKRQLPP